MLSNKSSDGGANSIYDLLRTMGLLNVSTSKLGNIDENSVANKALQQHYMFLQQKQGTGTLTDAEQKNFSFLKFAFDQESQRKIAGQSGSPSTYNGYLNRVYKDIKVVANESDIPKGTGNRYSPGSYSVQKVTEDMTRVGAGSRAGAPPLPKELIGTTQVTDTRTGQVTYYYVLNQNRVVTPSNMTPDGTLIPSKPEIYNKEKEEKVTSGGAKKNNTKPVKYPKLWYSPDYKKIYDAEIEQINLMLLETADMMLSNFDYKTIDSLAENHNPMISYQDDATRQIDYAEPVPNVATHQTDVFTANKIYEIVSRVIIPIRQGLDESRNTDYQEILYNFGYHNKKDGFIRYRPYYGSNGTAYYDLSISIPDISVVSKYKIYLIEEDGTI